MRKPVRIAMALPVIAGLAGCASQSPPVASSAPRAEAGLEPKPAARAHAPSNPPTSPSEVLVHKVNLIDGTPKDLSEYKGKVVMIVNVASACGLTPQYEGLESLYKARKDDGLVILGFPANDFGSQEPGSNQEIAQFCSGKYGVSFPMFEKISVKGEGAHPLYKQLTSLPEPLGGEPKWNFNKFVVDRSGRVVARFEPKMKPDDPAVVAKIDELLKS